MRDLLLPTTDAGALLQVVLLAVAVGALLWVTRRHRDLRLLVAGTGLLLLALMALRAAH